tara:strand:- start:405 stop:749 length:345 start_codon:yes stop_codon:yes gene_type:complete
MPSDDELISVIKDWLKTNEELLSMQTKIKQLKLDKKSYTTQIVLAMNDREIDGVNINNNTKLVHRKYKQKGGITKKLLFSALAPFVSDDTIEDAVGNIMNNRSEKVVDNIHLKL